MSGKSIAVIGEGITEKYYIESLKGLSDFTVLPRQLGRKASSLKKLQEAISNAINAGYDEIYCLIDMDTKTTGQNKINYERLKTKYHDKTISKKNKGIHCKVVFIETERCIELWFLYHFTSSAITRKFTCYDELERELQKYRPQYGKHDKYFRSIADLNAELTTKKEPNGSLAKAVQNAKHSVKTREENGRNHTYTEMYKLIEALGIDY